MTEAESFSRSFAVTFRFGEIYDFARNAIPSANPPERTPTAKFRRNLYFNIASRCHLHRRRRRRHHKDVVTSFSPPRRILP